MPDPTPCHHRIPRENNPNGYKYEVVGVRYEDDSEEVVGWTNHESGGSLLEGVKLWPRYARGFVREYRPATLDAHDARIAEREEHARRLLDA